MNDTPKAEDWKELALATLRNWQGLERHAIAATAQIIEQTDHPVVRKVMEIIGSDSMQHHRVQQLLIDLINADTQEVTPGELERVWAVIERHEEVEHKTIDLAKTLFQSCPSPSQRLLMQYLLTDEEKHTKILDGLRAIKQPS